MASSIFFEELSWVIPVHLRLRLYLPLPLPFCFVFTSFFSFSPSKPNQILPSAVLAQIAPREEIDVPVTKGGKDITPGATLGEGSVHKFHLSTFERTRASNSFTESILRKQCALLVVKVFEKTIVTSWYELIRPFRNERDRPSDLVLSLLPSQALIRGELTEEWQLFISLIDPLDNSSTPTAPESVVKAKWVSELFRAIWTF